MPVSKMSKKVASGLIKLIIDDQEYKPKDKLPNEKDLCSMFGVSRQVIREALKTLEAQGYLVTMHGSGSYVAENPGTLEDPLGITTQNIDDSIELLTDWYEARRVLESEVIKLTAVNATDEELENIKIKYESFSDIEKTRSEEMLFADRDFHLEIAKACHNTILEKCTLHLLQSFYFNLINSTTYVINRNLTEASDAHHKRMVDFLFQRDAEGAAMAVRAHMNHALEILKKNMKAG